MKNNEKIYLDEKGYESLQKDINKKKEELEELRKSRSDAYENGGDGFHDNFAFEELERKERQLIKTLTEREELLERAVLVDIQKDEKVVDVNDVVSLTIDFGDKKETGVYRLIGTIDIDDHEDIISITLNSPLGKAIYLSSVGKDVTYIVGNNTFFVHINNKIKENETKGNE